MRSTGIGSLPFRLAFADFLASGDPDTPTAVTPEIGSYIPVTVTGSFPNSLLGEMVV